MNTARGVLLALLLALMIPVHGAATHRPPDLAVASIEVTGPQPRWVNGSVEDSRIRVTVENRGAEPTGYTIRYYWDFVRDENYLNGDETGSTDVSRQPIPAHGSVQHNATWRVQPWQRGSGSIIAVLEVAGDAHTNNNLRALAYAVPVHDLRPRWDGVSDADMRPDELRFFRLIVRNAGTVQETVQLSPRVIGEDGDRFEVSLDDPVLVVPPGESVRTTFWVRFPFEGDPSSATVRYRVAVQSVDRPTVWGTTSDLDVSSVDAPYDGRFEFAVDEVHSPDDFIGAGEPTAFSLEVHNTGNRDDSYRVGAGSDAGWPITAAPQRAALRPGEAATVSVEVTPPAGAIPGTPAVLTLHVEPDHPVAAPQTLEFPVRVEGPLVRVEEIVVPERVYGDQPTPTAIRIANRGTQDSGNGTLRVTADPFTASMQSEFDLAPLAPGQQQTIRLDANWSMASGPATLKAVWKPGDPNAELGDALSVPVFVRVPGVSVVAPPGLTGVPGQSLGYLNAPYVFVVRNDGNAPEKLDLHLESETGTARLTSSPTLRLAGGETRSVGIEHAIPRPWHAGTTPVALTATLANRTDVNVTAEIETTVVDGSVPHVAFQAPPPRYWDPRNPLTLRVQTSDDTRVSLAILAVTRPDGDVDESAENDPPGVWTTTLALTPGNHSVEASAMDVAGRIGTTKTYAVDVRPFPTPQILEHWPADGAIVEGNLTISVLVADSLPVTVHARLDDGNETMLETRPGPGASWNATGSLATPPGNHTVEIVVRNEAGRTNVTSWRLTVADDQPVQDGSAANETEESSAPSPAWYLSILLVVWIAARRHAKAS